MSASTTIPEPTMSLSDVEHHLTYLKLSFIAAQYAELAKQAAHKAWPHVDYLARLVEGEADLRRDRATQSRIRLARFPVIKTLEQFRWDWPTRINRLQVQQHFHLEFIKDSAVVFWRVPSELTSRHDCLLLSKHIGKEIFRFLPELESFVHIQDQRLHKRLGLLTTRFPNGFEGEAAFRR
jgi:IstB-like ATP binding protein